ncbi:hypothetical protein ACFL4O_03815, partial [bacterium]
MLNLKKLISIIIIIGVVCPRGHIMYTTYKNLCSQTSRMDSKFISLVPLFSEKGDKIAINLIKISKNMKLNHEQKKVLIEWIIKNLNDSQKQEFVKYIKNNRHKLGTEL